MRRGMGTEMSTGAGRAQRQGPKLPRLGADRTGSGRRIRGPSHGRRGGRTKRRGRVGGEGPVRGPPRHGGIKAGRRRRHGQRSGAGTMQPGGAALLLCAAGLAAAPAPAPGVGAERRAAAGAGRERRVQFASWDEVNVLAHGLLQLGHGLKEHVERTKGQLRELGGRLSAHNSSLGRLLRQAREAQERGERLRGSVRELEGRGQQLLNLSEVLRQRLEEVAADKDAIQGRLERLESRVRLALQARPAGNQSARDLGALQSLMDAQNLRIEELLQKIKQQQYKLDKQNLQIKSLQSKVNLLIPLHHNKTQPPKWKINLKKSLNLTSQSQNGSGEPVQTQKLPEGCHQLFLAGQQSSGIFQVQPTGSQPFKVYCDMTAEGGWTVIQRRMDGSVDFDQLWDAYKNGFGDLHGDFWLGLEKIHHLVQEGKYNLLIELEDWEGNSQVVQFVFSLGGESTAYTLNLLGPLSGELENAIGEFRQLPFSTRDRDHDLKADTNCAKHLSGGWWFSTCGHANLNGKYFRSIPRQRHERKQGIFWKTWKGRYYPLKSTIMKIQPAALGTEP
ncbi:angiopoietin-related protein 4 [Vidua macroura]|uniref:angiopoietin-related protein 4 n=1 Tax=Vidua macroura TaxID=187451 RepID=UPI0023A8855C|nr:angiopoietin-related protein 4 [Vidua macroura]